MHSCTACLGANPTQLRLPSLSAYHVSGGWLELCPQLASWDKCRVVTRRREGRLRFILASTAAIEPSLEGLCGTQTAFHRLDLTVLDVPVSFEISCDVPLRVLPCRHYSGLSVYDGMLLLTLLLLI